MYKNIFPRSSRTEHLTFPIDQDLRRSWWWGGPRYGIQESDNIEIWEFSTLVSGNKRRHPPPIQSWINYFLEAAPPRRLFYQYQLLWSCTSVKWVVHYYVFEIQTLLLGGEGYIFCKVYVNRHLKTHVSKPGDHARSLRWWTVLSLTPPPWGGESLVGGVKKKLTKWKIPIWALRFWGFTPPLSKVLWQHWVCTRVAPLGAFAWMSQNTSLIGYVIVRSKPTQSMIR